MKRELLKHLGVGPARELRLTNCRMAGILVRAAVQDGSIGDFIGSLSQRGGRKLTIDEINEITTQGWAKRK